MSSCRGSRRRLRVVAMGLLALSVRAVAQESGRAPGPAALPIEPRSSAPSAEDTPAPSSPGNPIATRLFPGQSLQPIDLAGALRLAGAQNPDIALARQQVLQAVADLEQARALWLPTLFIGPTYYRVDGNVQNINGAIEGVSRGSLFLGATASMANGFPAPSPGTGFPALNGLSSVLRISDAIFEPLAAGRVAAAARAGLHATNNDTLLGVAEAYFDLQQAAGALAIAREAAANAERLAYIARAYAESGQGLEADFRRAQTEYQRRLRAIRGAVGAVKVASANLMRLLVMDPRLVVAPVEPAETVIRLVPDDIPLEFLLAESQEHRPELARAQETIKAACYRLKQAKLRPLVPAVAVTYAGGAFGGGQNAFFGDFSSRGDLAVSLFWDVRNLYLTDRGIIHRRKAERAAADLDLVRTRALVASEVVGSFEARAAAADQRDVAREAVEEAVHSLDLNFANIRRGPFLASSTRPIEVLQPIHALADARTDYLLAVIAYNRAQFRLLRALGHCPSLDGAATPPERGRVHIRSSDGRKAPDR